MTEAQQERALRIGALLHNNLVMALGKTVPTLRDDSWKEICDALALFALTPDKNKLDRMAAVGALVYLTGKAA